MFIIKSLLNLFLIIIILTSSIVAEEFKIPAMVGLTGASAVFGKVELEAYTLAIEEWNAKGGLNGKMISLELEDTQTNQRQILSAFQKLALNNPPVILGPTWLDTYQAVVPLAKQKGILLVTPSASKESFTKENAEWPITYYHNSTLEIKVLVDVLKKRGLEKIGLIYQQEPFAEMIRKLLLQNVPAPVIDLGMQSGEVDFNAALLKLKKNIPDVLILFVWDERSLSALLKQIRQHLPKVKIASVHDGEGWLKNKAFLPYLPQLIYSKFLLSDDTFQEKFVARFGHEPILTASNAYDTINAVLTALKSGQQTGTEIQSYLLNNQFKTVTFGDFKFSSDRYIPSKVIVVDYNDSQR